MPIQHNTLVSWSQKWLEKATGVRSLTMEVLRPSTPMPLGKAPTRLRCYQMNKRSSDSLPPLQPLAEENSSRRPYARKNLVCLQPRRHIVNSREGENVEIIGLSASKTNTEFYQEDRLKTVLPELNSAERLLAGREESDSLLITSRVEFKCAKRTNCFSPVRTQGVNHKGKQSAAKTDLSSHSSNSAGLPTVARNTKNNLNVRCNSSSTTALQKHIEQQEKEYDSASIKADIFQRWLQSQQK